MGASIRGFFPDYFMQSFNRNRKTSICSCLWLPIAVVVLAGILCAPMNLSAADYPEVMFILDGSGSMWGQAGAQTKIQAAKSVMAQVVPSLPPEVRLGLVVYGHRRKGDCTDIEVMIPPGSADRDAFLEKVAAVSPKGKTPMVAGIETVADLVKTKENETTIVLVSDGIETCHHAPCSAVESLKQRGIKFVLHVVGFGVDTIAREQLSCMAAKGGGNYFAAGDAEALLAALEAVKAEVAVKVEKAKTTTVKAKSRLGKLRITMPQSAVISLKHIKIIREKDGKVVKEAAAAADATHPLLSGDYKVVLAFANPNYKPPTDAGAQMVAVKGGETTALELGAIVINIAPGLDKAIAATGLVDARTGKPWVSTYSHNNGYYLFKPKPCPPGTYDFFFIPGNSKKPAVLAGGLKVTGGRETVATIDCGFALKAADGVKGWDLISSGTGATLLEIRRRWDNQWPLWKTFPVPPGAYDLHVHIKGMDEPLPAGEGIAISKGRSIVFDAGL